MPRNQKLEEHGSRSCGGGQNGGESYPNGWPEHDETAWCQSRVTEQERRAHFASDLRYLDSRVGACRNRPFSLLNKKPPRQRSFNRNIGLHSGVAVAAITVLGRGVSNLSTVGFGDFGAKSIFPRDSAVATAEKLAGEKYRTTLKRRIAFANLRLAVFLPTVHVFHKEGVAVVRRRILRQNLRLILA